MMASRRDTLQARTLQQLVDELLDTLGGGHVMVRRRGEPIDATGVVYAGRLIDLLSERHGLPSGVFFAVGEDTIVLHAPPRAPRQRRRLR